MGQSSLLSAIKPSQRNTSILRPRPGSCGLCIAWLKPRWCHQRPCCQIIGAPNVVTVSEMSMLSLADGASRSVASDTDSSLGSSAIGSKPVRFDSALGGNPAISPELCLSYRAVVAAQLWISTLRGKQMKKQSLRLQACGCTTQACQSFGRQLRHSTDRHGV